MSSSASPTLDAQAGAADRPTILIVAMANSIHTANWLNMLRVPDLRFILVPVYDRPVTPALRDWRPVSTPADANRLSAGQVGVFLGSDIPAERVRRVNEQIGYTTWRPSFMAANVTFSQPMHLIAAIRRFRPALVHSMEIQMAGYLCLGAKRFLQDSFPPWLLSNWGSDIYLYRKLSEHRANLSAVARHISFYMAECDRDVPLIRELGFDGPALPPMPASGGTDFNSLPKLSDLPPPSRRREVIVKGYHGWSGRALHVLSALQLAAPSLAGYRIRIALGATETLRAAAESLAQATALDVNCESFLPSHDDALARIARARFMVSLGISDGISTTLLEAMSLGCFPIQSNTSCCCEWIDDARSGFSVSPHDVKRLASLITRAATDDTLVDHAAPANRSTVERRWDERVNGPKMLDQYRRIINA